MTLKNRNDLYQLDAIGGASKIKRLRVINPEGISLASYSYQGLQNISKVIRFQGEARRAFKVGNFLELEIL